MENETKIIVTREQLKQIYDIACGGWKETIKNWTNEICGSFDNEGVIPLKYIEKMFEAANNEQTEVLTKIFPFHQTIEFPCFAKYVGLNLIVLFVDFNTGTVIASDKNCDDVGHFSNDWVSLKKREKWEILPKGSIIKI